MRFECKVSRRELLGLATPISRLGFEFRVRAWSLGFRAWCFRGALCTRDPVSQSTEAGLKSSAHWYSESVLNPKVYNIWYTVFSTIVQRADAARYDGPLAGPYRSNFGRFRVLGFKSGVSTISNLSDGPHRQA